MSRAGTATVGGWSWADRPRGQVKLSRTELCLLLLLALTSSCAPPAARASVLYMLLEF